MCKEKTVSIKVKGDCIILDGHYEIEKSRCDSAAKILEWVHHLAEKNWVDADLLYEFIERAAQLNKINIYVSA